MRAEEIAYELIQGHQRKQSRSKTNRKEVFVPSSEFFNTLIEDWVKVRTTVDGQDSRTLSREHKVGGFMSEIISPMNGGGVSLLTLLSLHHYILAQPGFASPFVFETNDSNSRVGEGLYVRTYRIQIS